MKLLNLVKKISTAEDGAVSIDWVVLTAGIVTISVAVGINFRNIADIVTGKVTTYAENVEIAPESTR